MIEDQMMFIVKEDEKVDALGLQDFHVLFHMLRPEVIDNEFAKNCVIDIFYYLYFENVPCINPDVASIFIARKSYLDWVMQTKEFECLKVKTINKKDKSLLFSVQIANAIIDAYRTIIKQYSIEDIQLINRFTGYKVKLFTASFLQETDYPERFVLLETEVCEKVIQELENHRDTFIKEIQSFGDALFLAEKEIFDNIDVPFARKSVE